MKIGTQYDNRKYKNRNDEEVRMVRLSLVEITISFLVDIISDVASK